LEREPLTREARYEESEKDENADNHTNGEAQPHLKNPAG
jgi:hypothetical protein